MNNPTSLRMVAVALSLIFGSPCVGQGQTAIPNDTGVEKRSPTIFYAILEIAHEQDQNPSKDWFPTGPRRFKSGYGKVANNIKAAFSIDLQSWAFEKGERLDNLTSTYIPYKKREEFAMWWWLRHDENYKKAAPWDKDQWKYEAIIDGTQLVWKAGNKATDGYSAAMIQGHDGLMAELIKTVGK